MGVWIETWNILLSSGRIGGHTLYGCVDWNTQDIDAQLEEAKVTPCMGVWIETIDIEKFKLAEDVTPCMGVWIETSSSSADWEYRVRHTLYGCVDWNRRCA